MTTGSTIRVGVLHSLSGTMAADEKHLAEVAQMAVDEMNEAAGVLSRQVEVVLRDGASDPGVFLSKARDLLTQGDVRTIFGCWMSSSRKAVKSVVEEHNALLWYPIQYEGLEESSNIIYTGSCLNQQIEPAVIWALSQGKKRCFLVGSDYVFPRTANSLIRALISRGSGSVVSEQYVPLGSSDLADVLDAIATARPDIVFNTINGDSNLALFREFRKAVGDAGDCPIMSFSFAESSLPEVSRESIGHYACWNYFQRWHTPENRRFLEKYRRRFGPHAVVCDPIATAYTQLYLWKQAVEQARSFDVSEILSSIAGCSVVGPGGVMEVQANHHVKKLALIGQATSQGRFDVVWTSEHPIDPKPWLGVEDTNLPTRRLVLEALKQYPEVIHVNVELDRRVRQRTAELEQANKALQKAHEELERRVEQRTAEVVEVNRKLVATLESITDGFVSLDHQWRFSYVNKAAAGYLRTEPEALLGNVVWDVFPKATELKFHEEFHRAVREGAAVHFEEFSPDPLNGWYECHCHPSSEGMSLYFRDITERKQAEAALERQRRSLLHMLRASDHERQTIAYDIHDELAQQLAAAIMQFQASENLKEGHPGKAKTAYDAGVEMVKQAHSEARRLISGVRPSALDEAGVAVAIAHLLHGRRELKGPQVEYRHDVGFNRLTPILENTIYRIAQEAVANACQHSQSPTLSVSLAQEGDLVRLEVQDHGIGFDPKAVSEDHFGLRGIKERARLLGGELTVESEPGKGTCIRVVLPVIVQE